MKHKAHLLFILSALAWLTATAQQNVNLKFGKPTKEELQMTTYAPDSTADAVILCRLTDVKYTIQQTGYLVDYYEKLRIKILKPSGARMAQMNIPYYKIDSDKSNLSFSKFSLMTGDVKGEFMSAGSYTDNAVGQFSNEGVEDLKVVAYNLEGSKTVKTTLNKHDVIKEQLDEQQYQLRFTVPAVKEGTVIECEYSIHSELFYMIHDWYAQSEIPVDYARLTMEVPCYLIYNMEEHGIQRLNCQCVPGTMVYKLESDPLAAPVHVKTNRYTCIGEKLKAMPKDNFVWNEHDYQAGITMELKGFSLPHTMFMDYNKTWNQIDRLVLDDDELGKRLSHHSPLLDELQAAKVADITNLRERTATVCQLVMSRVSWDGTYKLWPRNSNETLKEGRGSNADINLLLMQSLKDAGLEVAPVMLRSRDHGQLPYNFPSFQKLTTFVVAVMAGTTNIYVDASSAGLLDVLPAPLLVERARLMMKGKSQWVNLQKTAKSKTISVIEATLTTNGQLQGTQATVYEGLAALPHRNASSADFMSPEVKETLPVSWQGEATADGSILFSPFPTPPMQENPFKAEQRLMPVEYPSVQSEQVIVNIHLPEGYTLAQQPQQYAASTPDKSISGKLFVSQTEGKLQLQYQFNVNKVTHDSKEYPAIRQLYELFAEHCRDLLTVKHN